MSKRGAPTPNPSPRADTTQPFDYAAQWLDEPEVVELTLPVSKRKVLVRKPDLLDFIRMEGSRIPDPLAPLVYNWIHRRELSKSDSDQPAPEPSIGEKLRKEAEDAAYLDVIVVAGVVEPRFSLGEPQPGEVPVRRLHRNDRLHIWRWAEGIATPLLENFRSDAGGADGAVSPVGDGEGLPPEAERTAGPGEAGG